MSIWAGTCGRCSVARELRFPGAGTVSQNPLRGALGLKGLNPSRPYYLQFTMKVSETEFYRIVAEEAEKDFDPLELVYPKEVPVFEKYDEYLPAELIRKGFALGVLDIEGMKQRVLGWSKSSTS